MSNVSTAPKLAGMNYRIVSELGTGAGSTVFQISDKNAGGKRYALKVVKRNSAEDEIFIEQAKTEYEAGQKLRHAAIERVYDIRLRRSWFKVSGVDLLLEYVDGKTLDEIEAPDMGQLVLIFCQVASAITHMHRRGVFHGDLKPSNIMLTKAGKVKLIDFGTAWIKGRETNRAAGTPQFIAPEQAAERVINERTDVYNFGATMYRMFTGRFANASVPKLDNPEGRKLISPLKINPKLPTSLSEVIIACLELDPKRRPAGRFEIHQHLSAVAKFLGLDEVDLKGAEDEEF